MTKIVVFDSGFGSLSIIKPIQKITKSEIIYFADQKNFPYGKKSKKELKRIIYQTIKIVKENFFPDFIVLGSNTPSLLLQLKKSSKIILVLPPINEAAKISKTSNIAILATSSVVKSKELQNYIKKEKLPERIKIFKIDGSKLIDLVEKGKILNQSSFCRKKIREILSKNIIKNNIDVITLSSTHLPFLSSFLKKEFPKVVFLDPGKSIAVRVKKNMINNKSKKNSLKIFTTGNPKLFEKNLKKINIKNKVTFFEVS